MEAYCAEHGYERGAFEGMAWSAFAAVLKDRRARPLLLRAVASNDSEISMGGIVGLGDQRDDAALPEIETALRRFPDNALYLACFKSEAADRVAMKYLKDEDRADYERVR